MTEIVHVVAWGPDVPAGVMEPARSGPRIEALRRAGVVLLPADKELVERPPNGAAGWAVRSFGGHRARLPSPVPERVAPVAIWIAPRAPFVHWAVEFEREARNPERQGVVEPLGGHVRLCADTSQRGTIAPETGAASSPIALADLSFAPFASGGWADRSPAREFAVATGVLRAAVSIEGLLGLSLYGTGTGALVRRIGLSVCSKEDV